MGRSARAIGCCLMAAWLFAGPVARADQDRSDSDPTVNDADGTIAWKLTPTVYRTQGQPHAFDLNVRGNRDDHTFWVGYYRQADLFDQGRAGYERQFALPFGRIIGSAQAATRGFVGGSATLEVGRESWFGLAGWGRTNLKPYFNLNFDPNDSTLAGGGYRFGKDTVLTVFQVRDDRVNVGQRITHAVWRMKPDARSRLTVDVFRKGGWATDGDEPRRLRATGVAVTVDHGDYFARVAYDPEVNFSAATMWRLALGMRF